MSLSNSQCLYNHRPLMLLPIIWTLPVKSSPTIHRHPRQLRQRGILMACILTNMRDPYNLQMN